MLFIYSLKQFIMKKVLIILVALIAFVAVSCEKEEAISPWDVENKTIIGEWKASTPIVLGDEVVGTTISFNENDRWRAKGHFYAGLLKTDNDDITSFEWYLDGTLLVIAVDNLNGHNTNTDSYVSVKVYFDQPDQNDQLDRMTIYGLEGGDVVLKRSRY